MSSADALMFELFSLYSRALKSGQRDTYAVLSSGTNEFPAPRLYKRLWQQEIEDDLFYRYYTMQGGYPAVVNSLKLYENLVATGSIIGPQSFGDLCVTEGASGGVSGFFAWLHTQRIYARILLLGLNYALFNRCASLYKWPVWDLLSAVPNRILPTVDEVIEYCQGRMIDLLVLTLPGNPSGELYSEDELRRLLTWAKERDIYVLIDKVALDEFWAQRGKWVNVGKVVFEESMTERTTIVSSISKTRSLPGARLGYLIGNKALVDWIREQTRVTSMNPAIQMVLPVCLDALLRAIVVVEAQGEHRLRRVLISAFRRSFLVTNAMTDWRAEVFKELFSLEGVEQALAEMTAELNANFDMIEANHGRVLAVLGPHIAAVSSLDSGFNMAVQLSVFQGCAEVDICRIAFETKGLALFTEQCFRSAPTPGDNFWIRISLAAPPDVLERQLMLLSEYVAWSARERGGARHGECVGD